VLAAETPGCVECRIHLGIGLEKAGNLDEAQREYEEVLRADPTRQMARVHLGAVLARRGRADEGRALAAEAVAADPSVAESGARAFADGVALNLRENGDLNAALNGYRGALALFPDAPPLLLGQSEALERAGDHGGATDVCVRLLQVGPESQEAAARLDALCKSARPESPSCVVLWRLIAQSRSDIALPHLHLGLALAAAGDTAGARTALENALKINPALAEARDALGRLDNAAGSGKP
jgi:tetratricopeptide (TPR) repeat protein